MPLPRAAAAKAGELTRTLAAESQQSLTRDVLRGPAIAHAGL